METDEKVVDGLNGLLADTTVLYQKLRHYHWNITGKRFFELHMKFEELYGSWATSIDELAERVRTVGGTPLHTLRALLENASLDEDETTPGAPEMVERVSADLLAIHQRADSVIEAAEAVGDRGTVNMLDAMNDTIEKDRWMLRAWNAEAESAGS